VVEAFDVENETMSAGFESYRTILDRKHRASPREFRRTDFTENEDAILREKYLNLLKKKIATFPSYSENGKTAILPMIHGTTEAIAWKIATGNFGTVASLDAGYYGKGIYFTTQADYAEYYSHEKVLVIALVNPGNAYPVTEDPRKKQNYLGKPCRTGYQSHYTVLDDFYPSTSVEDNSRDEMVVFEVAQAFPKFIVKVKKT